MTFINIKPRRRNAGRPAEKSCLPYLRWLRGRNCACEGRNPNCGGGKIQAAHGPHKPSKGTGTKVEDRWAMPLSVNCHLLQHSMGWPAFAAFYLRGEQPLDVCRAFHQAWLRTPMGVTWERKRADG